MITIIFNQQSLQLDTNAALADLLKQYDCSHQAYALALNHQFIPRSTYTNIRLKDGDRIDLVAPMQGG